MGTSQVADSVSVRVTGARALLRIRIHAGTHVEFVAVGVRECQVNGCTSAVGCDLRRGHVAAGCRPDLLDGPVRMIGPQLISVFFEVVTLQRRRAIPFDEQQPQPVRQLCLGPEESIEHSLPQVGKGFGGILPLPLIDQKRAVPSDIDKAFPALPNGYGCHPRVRHQDDLSHGMIISQPDTAVVPSLGRASAPVATAARPHPVALGVSNQGFSSGEGPRRTGKFAPSTSRAGRRAHPLGRFRWSGAWPTAAVERQIGQEAVSVGGVLLGTGVAGEQEGEEEGQYEHPVHDPQHRLHR